MTKTGKQLAAVLLTAAMVVIFVSAIGTQTAFAEESGTPAISLRTGNLATESGTPAISSGAGILATDCNTENAATVYYAGQAWRVISFDGAGNEYTNPNDAMTLFSSGLLATGVKFNPDFKTYTNEYEGSSLQTKVNDLYSSLFSEKEQKAVVKRTLSEGGFTVSPPYSTGVSGRETSGYLWPLSTAEALALPSYAFRSVKDYWW